MFYVPVVKRGPSDTNDSLIRKFTKKVINEGILSEIRKRDRYTPPSEERKQKKAEFKRLSERRKKRKKKK